MERERVLIFDTSLRDGEQAPGCSMNIEEKLLLARKLQLLGVDIIEAGFPVASPGDAEAVRLIASEVEGPIIAAFARCTEKDIQAAWDALSRSPRAAHSHLSFDFGHSPYVRSEDRPGGSAAQSCDHGGLRAFALRRCRIFPPGRHPL